MARKAPVRKCDPAFVRLAVPGFDPRALTLMVDAGLGIPPLLLDELRVTVGVGARTTVRRRYAVVPVGIRYDEYVPRRASNQFQQFTSGVADEHLDTKM